jgi:Uncharacterized protein, possibly involved in aromatic compounds catabolism
MSAIAQPVMTPQDIDRFLITEFPQLHTDGRHFTTLSVGPGTATMRLDPDTRHLRPGGTISGPAMFTLADVACWITILAQIGPVAMVVTTNLNINFLSMPAPKPLDCSCRVLKLGKRLAVVDAILHQGDESRPVAQATGTYSIPPR